MEKLLNANEVAHLFGMSKDAVYRLAARGDLPAVRVGRRVVRFRPSDLERYLDRSAEEEA